MRLRLMLVSLSLLAGSAAVGTAAPSAAGPKPVRSGTIAGGTGVIFAGSQPAGERWGCEYAVDCQAWLQSDCNPALAGRCGTRRTCSRPRARPSWCRGR